VRYIILGQRGVADKKIDGATHHLYCA
jgi:hypothetical protein